MPIDRLVRETLGLRDGRQVVLRPIRRSDALRLIDLHGRLSSDTQYLRFFGPKPELTADEAEYLAAVDFDRRFAVVASVKEAGRERVVAVGRFDTTTAETAECAIVVRDDYQRQGLGTALLQRLVQVARGRGLKAFSGEVLAENTQMLNLLRRHGLEIGTPNDAVVAVRATIDQAPFVLRVLQSAAEGTAGAAERVIDAAEKAAAVADRARPRRRRT